MKLINVAPDDCEEVPIGLADLVQESSFLLLKLCQHSSCLDCLFQFHSNQQMRLERDLVSADIGQVTKKPNFRGLSKNRALRNNKTIAELGNGMCGGL